jgi:hypothetical protein
MVGSRIDVDRRATRCWTAWEPDGDPARENTDRGARDRSRRTCLPGSGGLAVGDAGLFAARSDAARRASRSRQADACQAGQGEAGRAQEATTPGEARPQGDGNRRPRSASRTRCDREARAGDDRRRIEWRREESVWGRSRCIACRRESGSRGRSRCTGCRRQAGARGRD